MKFRFLPSSAALVLALSAVLTLSAQSFRGAINGSVQDTSGAAVPNAKVTITSDATGVARETVTSGAGEFNVPDLPLGSYTLQVSTGGFADKTVHGVTVTAGNIYTVPIQLAVSGDQTVVNVTANALALDTTSVQQTTTLNGSTLQSVPLNGRDFKKLAGFLPGFGGYSGVIGSINGSRANQTNWQIDGTDNNDLWANNSAVNQGGVQGIAGVILPIDATEEFSVATQNTPESGRNPGATVDLVVKSGTNQLHGSLYYFNRNEALAVDPVFVPKNKLRNENYGVTLGGPIRRDKTFAFVAYEKQQFVIGIQGTGTEPSTAYQGLAEQLLAANNIPVNPVGQALLNTLYEPGALAAAAAPNNFIPSPESGASYNGVFKLDHSINERNTLSFRYVLGTGNQIAPAGGVVQKYYFEVAPIHVQNYNVVYNRVFTPRLSNQLLAGVSSFNQVFSDFNHSFNVNTLGLETNSGYSGAPTINVSGFDQVGVTQPIGRRAITGQLNEAASWVVGAHQFRFGGEYRHVQLDEFYLRNVLGTFNFDGSQGNYSAASVASLFPGRTDTTNIRALADFLAGKVSTSTLARGNQERLVYVESFNLFAQDAWQVNRRLNLNYGLRYDFQTPPYDNKKDLSVFVPTRGGLLVQGDGIGSLYPKQWVNFGPRVGFAYQPPETTGTVLRGSYGIFYDTVSLSPYFDNRPTGTTAPNGIQGNPAGSSPVQTIQQNRFTIVPNQPLFTGGPNAIVGLFSISQQYKTPTTQNFSFTVEQSLGRSSILSIGYVGSQARHQTSLRDINQVPFNSASTTPIQSNRPYFSQFPQYGAINQVETIGNGNYNSLQATLRTQEFHGLSTGFNYTWSHSLDDMTQSRARLPQDSYDFKAEYGNSDYDTRNAFNAVVHYALPASKRGPRLLTNGWEVNGAVNVHDGQPFNITNATDNSGTADRYQRPNLVGNPYSASHAFVQTATSRYVQWIDPAAFAQPSPGTAGNLRRNSLYAPGFADTDISVFKNTHITERVNAQLRVEMFNVGNRINLAAPSSSFGSGSFGRSTDTIGDSNGAPGIGPGEPYNTQIALKILF